MWFPSFPANRSRIVASVLVPTPLALHVDPGTEDMAMTIRINNAKTVGIGGCTGCLDPVCIIFIELLLSSANSGDIRIVYPLWSHFATWQGDRVVLNMYGCPGGSPVTNQTWGGIKAIYR